MPNGIENRDLRSVKTGKALSAAMFSLLSRHSFRKITVRDICEEAMISRATFYSYYTDKYNFLEHWLISAWPDNVNNIDDDYEVKEKKVNQYVNGNKTIIKNLLMYTDSWTLDALFNVLHYILNLTTDKTIDGQLNPKYVVMSNFYVGGMIYYIMWQVKNDFPQGVAMMNNDLYEVIKIFRE